VVQVKFESQYKELQTLYNQLQQNVSSPAKKLKASLSFLKQGLE
jgi:hypothetical protein